MRTSPRATGNPLAVGAEWIRLDSVGHARRRAGFAALAGVGFAGVFVLIAFVVERYGGAGALAALIYVGSLVLAVAGIWSLLAAVGPRPRLWASRTQVTAGDTLKVRWEAAGRFKEARSIQVTWIGREVAIERGYDGGIYKHVFTTNIVTRETGPLSGTASIDVPLLVMPSFAARNSRIEWLLQARVRTEGWPRADERYLIEVIPSRVDR